MSESRMLVAAVLLLSAVGCGGSVRGDGGGGSEAGAAAGHAGAPHSDPGAGGAGGASPGSAGSPSPGSSGAGSDGSCLLGDVRYANGASWKCDCNTCFCRDGSLGSTLAICFACQYGGYGYSAGDSFPALDGCNTCSCSASGEVACTQKACACNPGTDPLHYVLTDPQQCNVSDYECPANTMPFQNACGCGCEQPADCPSYIDCSPGPAPSNCAAEKLKCPYSAVAL